MAYLLAYTEEARACLGAMERVWRSEVLEAVFLLAEDPHMEPSAPLAGAVYPGVERTIRLASSTVIQYTALEDKKLLVVVAVEPSDPFVDVDLADVDLADGAAVRAWLARHRDPSRVYPRTPQEFQADQTSKLVDMLSEG